MAFDWAELIYLAEDIQKGKAFRGTISRECCLRTVCSRAYYSAFCITRDYEIANGSFVSNPKGNDHKNLYFYLKKKLGKTAPVVQVFLDLRLNRNDCDYHNPLKKLRTQILESEAKKAIHSAKQIITNHCCKTI